MEEWIRKLATHMGFPHLAMSAHLARSILTVNLVQRGQHDLVGCKKCSTCISNMYLCHDYKNTVSTLWMLAGIDMFKHRKVRLKNLRTVFNYNH